VFFTAIMLALGTCAIAMAVMVAREEFRFQKRRDAAVKDGKR